MKLYCFFCREYILETTDKFVVGGPYHGAMFSKADQPRWSNPDYFQFSESAKNGDLYCPRCCNNVIRNDGSILSEHGIIQKGQKSVDTSHSIIYCKGELAGKLMTVNEFSKEEAKPVFTCPECGKEFDNKGRLKFHHLKVHGKKLNA